MTSCFEYRNRKCVQPGFCLPLSSACVAFWHCLMIVVGSLWLHIFVSLAMISSELSQLALCAWSSTSFCVRAESPLPCPVSCKFLQHKPHLRFEMLHASSSSLQASLSRHR
ncbi:hypothetical protein M758_1G024400 [Ceratodon purpureus]|nr:hypothetical protein M758_1G024400 [Ceratodon purpureus]